MWVLAQELERSLDCKHIAPNAAQALLQETSGLHLVLCSALTMPVCARACTGAGAVVGLRAHRA